MDGIAGKGRKQGPVRNRWTRLVLFRIGIADYHDLSDCRVQYPVGVTQFGNAVMYGALSQKNPMRPMIVLCCPLFLADCHSLTNFSLLYKQRSIDTLCLHQSESGFRDDVRRDGGLTVSFVCCRPEKAIAIKIFY